MGFIASALASINPLMDADQLKFIGCVVYGTLVLEFIRRRATFLKEMDQQAHDEDGDIGRLDAVGGHGSKKGKGAPILVRGEKILKPFQPAQHGREKNRGELEANFYQYVFAQHHPLERFVPKYYGIETMGDVHYVVMENLLHHMKSPCMLDLKMGQQTYDEDASPSKIEREKKKYPPQEVIGFRIVGMKVHRSATGETWRSNREWCMQISPDSMHNAIEHFFFDGKKIRYELIEALLVKLADVVKVLSEHATWRMYGSSLLILYDAADPTPKSLCAKMIDFAHVYKIQDNGTDDGYLHGLKFLMGCLQLTLASRGVNAVGGHGNVSSPDGNPGVVVKLEDKPDQFDTEVRFYEHLQLSNDALVGVTPQLLAVNQNADPREMRLSDAAMLVSTQRDAVSIMDCKLGVRSYRSAPNVHGDFVKTWNTCSVEGLARLTSTDLPWPIYQIAIIYVDIDASNVPGASYYNKYASFVLKLVPSRASRIWAGLPGVESRDGPSCLKDGLLGKRDYLRFRDATTTSAIYGYRLSGLRHGDYAVSQNEARSIENQDQFCEKLERFLWMPNGFNLEVALRFRQQLEELLDAIAKSAAFPKYEFIGSSLLFMHCGSNAAIRWIDFANTIEKPCKDENGIRKGIENLKVVFDILIQKHCN